ncbi:hypothetical protein ADL19_06705 [Streptomyces purpurogeneiscleroticus]|nr:hypothetical protein ADL19_06705 [Streptomyces purpurogeneiscleroticus]
MLRIETSERHADGLGGIPQSPALSQRESGIHEASRTRRLDEAFFDQRLNQGVGNLAILDEIVGDGCDIPRILADLKWTDLRRLALMFLQRNLRRDLRCSRMSRDCLGTTEVIGQPRDCGFEIAIVNLHDEVDRAAAAAPGVVQVEFLGRPGVPT